MLLTVDLVAQGVAGAQNVGSNDFCICEGPGDMRSVSLIDTVHRVRYGPLRQGSLTGPTYASNINYLYQPVGTTYRIGVFFPDPGTTVTTMGVDLQLGGIAPGIPIVNDGTPVANLVAGGADGTTAVAPSAISTEGSASAPAGSTPSSTPALGPSNISSPASTVTAATGGDHNGPLVTWPALQPAANAYVDRHDLIAKVVGGTVNEGGNHKQGIVTLNADVLFAFNSAKLNAKAAALIRQAGSILNSKAEPSKPVTVIGYTDGKGDPSYNLSLSEKRADSVVKSLHNSRLTGLKLQSSGKGESDPVAPNTKVDGSDSPRGRALNRRVEITYQPKQGTTAISTPTTSPSGISATHAPGAAAGAIDLPPATVKGNGVYPATMTATVYPIIEDDTLSLVSIDVTASHDTLLIDAFSSRSKADQDIGIFTITDPATKRVYLPAYDADNSYRIMGTYTHRLTAGQPLHFAFYAAELPATLGTATVDLDQLGTAKSVRISR